MMASRHDTGTHIIMKSVLLMLMPGAAAVLYAALAYLVRLAVHALTGWTMPWASAVGIAIAMVLTAAFWCLHADAGTEEGSHGSR